MRPPDVPPAGEPTDPVAVVPKEGEENEDEEGKEDESKKIVLPKYYYV